jgi:hypothetical protein
MKAVYEYSENISDKYFETLDLNAITQDIQDS